jgi:hypothetical protein
MNPTKALFVLCLRYTYASVKQRDLRCSFDLRAVDQIDLHK